MSIATLTKELIILTRKVAGSFLNVMPLTLHVLIQSLSSKQVVNEKDCISLSNAELFGLGSVLVVAPHPDDETLGCGGLLALLALAGHPVRVAFVSDGGASHPTSALLSRSDLAEIRQQEAVAALYTLGINAKAATFLMMLDGALPSEENAQFDEAVQKVGKYLESCEIDTVVLPWRRDSSQDHRAVWQMFQEAFRRRGVSPRILEYPIWVWSDIADAPRPGEMLAWRLNILSVLDKKRRAIMCHQSQLSDLFGANIRGFRISKRFLANFLQKEEIFFEARACCGRVETG